MSIIFFIFYIIIEVCIIIRTCQGSLLIFSSFIIKHGVPKELAFLELELGLNKLCIKFLGAVFSVFNLCLDVPDDIKWSKNCIVYCSVGIVLELNESRRHNSHDLSTLIFVGIFAGGILTDGGDLWNSKSLFLLKLIQEDTFFRESDESSGLSQVIFLVDVVHLWVEHHNSVDKGVQSEVVGVWINHVHDVVTHAKLNNVA